MARNPAVLAKLQAELDGVIGGLPGGAGPHNMDNPPKNGPNHLGLWYNMLP